MTIQIPRKYLVLFISLILFPLAVNAQYSPGGIGNTDGSDGEPELKLWLLPDSLASSLGDGEEINTWMDYSGNDNHLTGAGSNGNPVYYENVINGHSALSFENDRSRAVISSFAMPSEAVGVFFVLRTDGTQRLSPLSYAASDDDDNEYMFINYQSDNETFGAFIKDAYNYTYQYNDNN